MSLRLSLRSGLSLGSLRYQRLEIDLTRPDRLTYPTDLVGLALPPGLDPQQGVVLSGRAPIWVYGWLVHECHITRWVACFDPRLGAVVVSSHSPEVQVGQVLPLGSDQIHPHLCPAVMVVGPPDSGKSTLSHALFQALLPTHPDIYLQRAQWDGEGNWVLELDPQMRETLKQPHRGQLTPEFFGFHAQAILQLRRQKRLVLVDVGGMVQPEKIPLVEACSHYLVVSREPSDIEAWHEFCRDRGNLCLVGVIHTQEDPISEIRQSSPSLELCLGGWDPVPPLPGELLEALGALVGGGEAMSSLQF
ncbi:MAG: CRISPR-associated protein Csx3 [Synechococcaceae cyanobacterium SM2_3_2]|nr:CRISPR-associated protein Csx3 [Synechococcaceae cyanobacterium SM2_3_2]